jgi:LAO/AO transport system kinase
MDKTWKKVKVSAVKRPSRGEEDPSDLVTAVLEGDLKAATRLITHIERESSGIPAAMDELRPRAGKAHVVGVTGPPGVGKSTLIDKIVEELKGKGKSIGVILVDPSSPFSGGAILGDRTRMQRHTGQEDIFIRSFGTRGHLGGVCRSISDVVTVMDAMGKDVVIVETVGTGQSETEIMNVAHTCVVVLMPGSGDGIQALKAGILEIADIYVINKDDYDGADKLEGELREVIPMSTRRLGSWAPPIYRTEAHKGKGVEPLVAGLEQHRNELLANVCDWKGLADKARFEFLKALESRLFNAVIRQLRRSSKLERIIEEILNRQEDPYSAADKVVADLLRER